MSCSTSLRLIATKAHHEAHISTEQDPSQPNPWFSRTYGKQRWTTGSRAAPLEGPQATDSVGARHADGVTIRRLPFSSRQRIRATADFDNVYKNGRRGGDNYFGVAYRTSDGANARLGMSVGVRMLGSSVGRNRLRRLIRESFRQHQHELPAVDIVITARTAARGAAAKDLRTSLETHWQNLIRKCAASS
jgi:ribonuclease P protein component